MLIQRGSCRNVVLILSFATPGISHAGELAATGVYRNAVMLENVRDHQKAFQQLADENEGHRGAGSSGYDASAAYVGELLASYGYEVTHQTIWYPGFFDITPPILTLNIEPPIDFVPNSAAGFFTAEYSGSGDVTERITPVDLLLPPNGNTPTSGCEAADFAGFPTGNIALIQRGFCTFRVKAENALAAGASGVIIFNDGTTPARTGAYVITLNLPEFSIPVVMTSYDIGVFLSGTNSTVRLAVNAATEKRKGNNVFAERPGCDDSVVMIGAHLDSVYAGPGINDNGSGSAAVLELAIQMAELDIQPARTVRFAWWTFEEQGLIGSEVYVNNLPPEELARIDLYLNLDMIGSPNFVRYIYDGDGSSSGFPFPPGSDAIEVLFRDYFAEIGLPIEELTLTASDNWPFILRGIAVGGLFTGAGGIKTAEEAAVYGGTAGIALDPCYHQPCDTYENVNTTILDQMADAAAHALLTLAQDETFCAARDLSPGEAGFRGVTTAEFANCMSGPDVAANGCCVCSDLVPSDGVDLGDYAIWQNRFGVDP